MRCLRRLDVVTWLVAVKGASINLAQQVLRKAVGQGRGAGHLHQRRPVAADPESASDATLIWRQADPSIAADGINDVLQWLASLKAPDLPRDIF